MSRKMPTLLLFLLTCLPMWAQLTPETWRDLVDKGNTAAVIKALTEQKPGFKINAAMMQELCGEPELMQAVLDFLYGEPGLKRTISASEGETSDKTSIIRPAVGSTEVMARTIAEQINALAAARRLGDDPVGKRKLVETRQFLISLVMSAREGVSSERFLANYGEMAVPDWALTMMRDADLAREKSFPRVRLSASRKASFFIPDREDGVRAYLSLYMVKSMPVPDTEYDLVDQFLSAHEAFPLTYNESEQTFELHRLEHRDNTLVRLQRVFKDMEPLTLYPGKWAIRFRHTTGKNDLRSDKTHFFEVEPGKSYDLTIDLIKAREGKELDFRLVEN